MNITFTIPGAAVGKGRPKFARRGDFVHTYTPEKTASYENLVKLYSQMAMKKAKMSITDRPVNVSIVVRAPIPKSFTKKKKMDAAANILKPTSKPDLDNVAKGILDAMNGIVFHDDKQVVALSIMKMYNVEPYTTVFVKEEIE